MKTTKKTAPRSQRHRRRHSIEAFIHNGVESLRDQTMRVTIADFSRLLDKELESNPRLAPARPAVWFDELDAVFPPKTPDA